MIVPYRGTEIETPNLSNDDILRAIQLFTEGKREECKAFCRSVAKKALTADALRPMKAAVAAEARVADSLECDS